MYVVYNSFTPSHKVTASTCIQDCGNLRHHTNKNCYIKINHIINPINENYNDINENCYKLG